MMVINNSRQAPLIIFIDVVVMIAYTSPPVDSNQ